MAVQVEGPIAWRGCSAEGPYCDHGVHPGKGSRLLDIFSPTAAAYCNRLVVAMLYMLDPDVGHVDGNQETIQSSLDIHIYLRPASMCVSGEKVVGGLVLPPPLLGLCGGWPCTSLTIAPKPRSLAQTTKQINVGAYRENKKLRIFQKRSKKISKYLQMLRQQRYRGSANE